MASRAGRLRTTAYATVWGSNDRLFAYLVLTEPDGYRGHWLHALAVRNAGYLDTALPEFTRAYTLYPRDRQLTIDFTNALLAAGKPKDAAGVAAHLMDFADFRADSNAVGLYLETIAQAYGADSARAMEERLAPALRHGGRQP